MSDVYTLDNYKIGLKTINIDHVDYHFKAYGNYYNIIDSADYLLVKFENEYITNPDSNHNTLAVHYMIPYE